MPVEGANAVNAPGPFHLFPEFACADDIRSKRLILVLGRAPVDVGSVWLLHAPRRFLAARVRAFIDLCQAALRVQAAVARGPRQ